MKLDWDDITVDWRAVTTDPVRLIEDWRWLVSYDAEALLPTACGDLFLRRSDGSIAFLDTHEGSFAPVAANDEQWKGMLDRDETLKQWFKCGLVAELLEAGLRRGAGQCFSPIVPQVIGGTWEPANFIVCDLAVHLIPMGQIHEQVKSLPLGTKINRIDVQWQ